MSRKLFSSPRIREIWGYRQEPENIAALASIIWRALLVLGVVIVAVALWFGFQELGAASDAETPQATTGAAAPALNRSQLQATLTVLTARQAQYQSLSQSPLPAVADPAQ